MIRCRRYRNQGRSGDPAAGTIFSPDDSHQSDSTTSFCLEPLLREQVARGLPSFVCYRQPVWNGSGMVPDREKGTVNKVERGAKQAEMTAVCLGI